MDPKRPLLDRVLQRTAQIPEGTFGRVRRMAGSALKTSSTLALKKALARGKVEEIDWGFLEKLVEEAGQLKGVAMKMGQIMSYIDAGFPPEAQRILAVLQRASPPMPFERVRAVVEAELGPKAEALLGGMEPRPIAAASIGQVHRATLEGIPVAVKVQYPEIEGAIRADFKAAIIGKGFWRLLGLDVSQNIDEAERMFLDECDYAREAEWQGRFARLYADHPVIQVPEVCIAHSSKRVLVTRFFDGISLDDFLETDPPQALRDTLGEALFEFYMGSLYQHGIFNADPHPGNYLITPDHRLVILDYGCVRGYDEETRQGIKALARATLDQDDEALREAGQRLGFDKLQEDKPFARFKAFVRGFFGSLHERGVHEIDDTIDADFSDMSRMKIDLIRMNMPGKFIFLLRIRFGLQSVLAKLGAKLDWRALEREALEA